MPERQCSSPSAPIVEEPAKRLYRVFAGEQFDPVDSKLGEQPVAALRPLADRVVISLPLLPAVGVQQGLSAGLGVSDFDKADARHFPLPPVADDHRNDVVLAAGNPKRRFVAGIVEIADQKDNRAALRRPIQSLQGRAEACSPTDRLMRGVERRLAAEGADKMTLEAAESEVTAWTKERSGQKQSFSYALKDGHLILSNALAGLVETLARSGAASGESFSENEKYRHVMQQASPEGRAGVVRWYVDPTRLVEALLAPSLQEKAQMQMVRGFLRRSGLDQLQALGGSIDLASGGFDSVSRVAGYVAQPAQGLLGALRLPASRQRPPDWVSDDVSLYAQANWNPGRAYRAVADFVDSFHGAGSFDETVGSMPLGETGLKLKEDFVDQLAGPLHIVADLPESLKDATRQPALFGIGVRDAERMGDTIRQLAEASGAEPREVEGETIYELTFPSAIPGQTATIGAAVASGNLMVSTDAGFLARLLRDRGRKRPLAESRAYQKVAEHFPEKTSMITYQRQDQQIESLYESIRSGTLMPQVPGIAAGLDFSKLPRFDVLRRYLQSTGSYIEPTPDGFRMIDFALPPREQ